MTRHEELARSFDLLVIDHPFIGQADRTGCFRDLRELIAAPVLSRLTAQGAGPSGQAYVWRGKVFALPTDAAAQVASYREDLLADLAPEPPRCWADVLLLAERARANGQTLSWAGTPTDAACTFLTLAANLGHPPGRNEGEFLPAHVTEQVMRHLHWIVQHAQPSCLVDNPIRVYEAMLAGERMVYCPAAFGYSNYARQERRPWLRFAPLAGPGAEPSRGALLGGAGMAISSHSVAPRAAAAFLAWLHSAKVQRGLYASAGGQPGNLAAWRDRGVNAMARDFFAATLTTLEAAWVRPRFAGIVAFVEAAGGEINRCLRGQTDMRRLQRALTALYHQAWAERGQALSPALKHAP
ncbi:extracellular solute-binding protein [Verminephrobacter eiseniae]|uniref:extracellular solute-binding protein n=1 Tax=Verminephrobacter eiseniae TaxID=364317 RepID=UPI002236F80F|nr:extracellular solute-binding protein [Verminephrobacter eiseniae]MCW5259434.1 extracellular solute-binding protein [Verminephrobacter eiseniae]